MIALATRGLGGARGFVTGTPRQASSERVPALGVRGQWKRFQPSAVPSAEAITLPASRAEILVGQAKRPRAQELLVSWAMWALLTVFGTAVASLALKAYSYGFDGAWPQFLANPSCDGLVLAIPAVVLLGTLAQGFQAWQWSLAGGLGVATAKAFGGQEPQDWSSYSGLKERVAALGLRAGLPQGSPRVFVVPTQEPNAFAAGLTPDDSVVAVTQGLLDSNLSPDELDAVLAHEVGHIFNGDCAAGMQIAFMVAGFSFLMSLGVRLMDAMSSRSRSSSDDEDEGSGEILAVAMVFAGALLYSLGYLLQSWHSRRREFAADEAAVALTGTGALAGALAKIEQRSLKKAESYRALAEQQPQFAHLYISSHSDRESGFLKFISRLLKSYPGTDERKKAIGKTLRKVGTAGLPETQSTV